jgi:hypothetical protein
VLKDISAPLSRLTGKTITGPTISAVPATACRLIAVLARTRLPAGCGQIPLFPACALTGARRAFRILNASTLALLILTPAAGATALLAAPRRYRALLQTAIGGGLTILTASVVATLLQSSLTTRAQPRYQPVLTVILHALTSGFFTLALWCTISSLVLATDRFPLVRQHRIRNGAGKTTTMRVILSSSACGNGSAVKVPPRARDFRMHPRDPHAGLLPVPAPLLLAGQVPLRFLSFFSARCRKWGAAAFVPFPDHRHARRSR